MERCIWYTFLIYSGYMDILISFAITIKILEKTPFDHYSFICQLKYFHSSGVAANIKFCPSLFPLVNQNKYLNRLPKL